MSNSDSDIRRHLPKSPLGQFALAAILTVTLLEMASSLPRRRRGVLKAPALVDDSLREVFSRYAFVRVWVMEYPLTTFFLVATVLLGLFLAARAVVSFWNNGVIARLVGTRVEKAEYKFPHRSVELPPFIARRPRGTIFVGLTPKKGLFGWRWKPVYLSHELKAMHRHVMGKTGSGKTLSVLWPSVLQDALDGKGVVVMDAKGSEENILAMKSIAALSGREKQLRVFSLPAWNRPQLFSHDYNLVWVRPRTSTDSGGDARATAERVFSVLSLGDNAYYNTQAEVLFTNLCELLHGMLDENGNGLLFNVRDLSACVKGLGNNTFWANALEHCLLNSINQEASREIQSQAARLGRDVSQCFSGLAAALDKFLSPLVNSYAPDINFEQALRENQLVYVQLPANLFKIQAPALGRAMLMDLQQEGSLRQVFRDQNQTPCSVVVDEFYNFADRTFIDSLNKLRDANIEFTLAHQSLADLELVSPEFATAVWDNTRTKDILAQDNPLLCEKVAKSIGTHQVQQKTVRVEQGALFTSRLTGDASSKWVEEYRLHPNTIKNLARCGQGFHLGDEDVRPISYGMLPDIKVQFPLTKTPPSTGKGLGLYEKFCS